MSSSDTWKVFWEVGKPYYKALPYLRKLPTAVVLKLKESSTFFLHLCRDRALAGTQSLGLYPYRGVGELFKAPCGSCKGLGVGEPWRVQQIVGSAPHSWKWWTFQLWRKQKSDSVPQLDSCITGPLYHQNSKLSGGTFKMTKQLFYHKLSDWSLQHASDEADPNQWNVYATTNVLVFKVPSNSWLFLPEEYSITYCMMGLQDGCC